MQSAARWKGSTGNVGGLPGQRVQKSEKRFARLHKLLHSFCNNYDAALENKGSQCSNETTSPKSSHDSGFGQTGEPEVCLAQVRRI